MIPKDIKFGKIPKYGDKMVIKEWLDCCKTNFFIDYDGWGYYATAKRMSEVKVRPSDTEAPDFAIPEWATHIVWFNK